MEQSNFSANQLGCLPNRNFNPKVTQPLFKELMTGVPDMTTQNTMEYNGCSPFEKEGLTIGTLLCCVAKLCLDLI